MKDIPIRVLIAVLLMAVVALLSGPLQSRLGTTGNVKTAMAHGRHLAGVGRLVGHVQWMRLLQFRSRLAQQENLDTARAAEELHRRYQRITRLTPDLVTAYQHGTLELALMGSPEQGLDLVDRGLQHTGDKDWILPFYAAQIAGERLGDWDRAERYLREALRRTNNPEVTYRSLVRVHTQRNGKTGPVGRGEAWAALVRSARDNGLPSMTEYAEDMGGGILEELARTEILSLHRALQQESESAGGEEAEALARQAAQLQEIARRTVPRSGSDLEQVKLRAAEALARLQPEDGASVAFLANRVRGKGQQQNLEAAAALLRVAPESDHAQAAHQAFRNALSHDGAERRLRAVRLLAEVGEAAQPLIPMLARRLQDPEIEVATATADALGRIGQGSDAAVTALHELMQTAPPAPSMPEPQDADAAGPS